MLVFELLVPPTKAQLDRLDGSQKAYDDQLRPGLMVQAFRELQDSGVEPDLRKIEGIDRREGCEPVVAAARRNGRDKVGCIVLGGGEDDTKVREWLAVASSVPRFIGFAVSRTSFWEPLMNWRAKKATRDEAAAGVARRYQEWVGIFEEHTASVRRAGAGK